MGALMQISAVHNRHDSDGRLAMDAASLTGRPGRAVAVLDLSRGEGSTQGRLNVSDTWCGALFASWLQPSDAPTAEMAAKAIECTTWRFGIGGCVGRMAQEFGDHPEAAAERMRWVRRLAAELREAGDEPDV